MQVGVVTLELRALLDRLVMTSDYEACVLGLGGGDGDPYSEMNVWLSNTLTSGTWDSRAGGREAEITR
jgi:hypothetical protein